MATANSTPPLLILQRSAQSGDKVMTAAYAVVYVDSSSQPYIFAGAEVDLSTMQAGDVVDIRVRKRLADGGALVVHDERSYSGARPTTHPSIRIAPITDIYGVEIAMRQTAGVLRTFSSEFYPAKRFGLA